MYIYIYIYTYIYIYIYIHNGGSFIDENTLELLTDKGSMSFSPIKPARCFFKSRPLPARSQEGPKRCLQETLGGFTGVHEDFKFPIGGVFLTGVP